MTFSSSKGTAAVVLAAALAACSAQNASPVPFAPDAPAHAGGFALRAPIPDKRAGGPFLYVANVDGSSSSSSSSSSGGGVNVYSLGRRGKLVRTIGTDGTPRSIAFDASGNLYVAEAASSSSSSSSSSSAGSIAVYAVGSGRQMFDVTRGVNSPTAVAISANGVLYVANGAASSSSSSSGTNGSITIYRRGNRKLFRTISNGIGNPIALAFDGAGRLYVLNATGGSSSSSSSSSSAGPSVAVYTRNHTDPALVITAGITAPSAMAVDSAGDVVVANGASSSSSSSSSSAGSNVEVYAAGTSSPAATLTAGVSGPVALGLDASGNLYVANGAGGSSSSSSSSAFSGSVAVYASGGASPIRTIVAGVNAPDSMVVLGSGALALGNAPGSSSSSSSSSSSGSPSVAYYNPRSLRPAKTFSQHLGTPVALGISGH
jgi:hypothetical protein